MSCGTFTPLPISLRDRRWPGRKAGAAITVLIFRRPARYFKGTPWFHSVKRSALAERSRAQVIQAPLFALMFLAALDIVHVSPQAVLWTAPAILLSAMLIAWAAESAQFFIA